MCLVEEAHMPLLHRIIHVIEYCLIHFCIFSSQMQRIVRVNNEVCEMNCQVINLWLIN